MEKKQEIEILKEKYKKYEMELQELNKFIYENPELGNCEFKAKEKHLELLLKNGFIEEKLNINIPTAYKAVYKNKKEGPIICYMAEYDALPGIGHGCGHNILGVTSIAAGLLLKEYVDIYGGEVVLLGTPAEETNGAKVDMGKMGIFNNIDVAMMSHPTSQYHYKSGKSRAMDALQFTFKGKTAHAAGDPYNGINALDAAVNFYTAINSIKHQIKNNEAIIHGIISNGGKAANIVPDIAVANFYIRADKLDYLNRLTEKVKQCALGIALATGTEVEIENYEYSFANLITNNNLMKLYEENMKIMGIELMDEKEASGSTDAGDASHYCPVIHTYFPISKEKITGHSIEMAAATIKQEAYTGMKEAVLALTMTGLDILKNLSLLKEIKKEFIESEK